MKTYEILPKSFQATNDNYKGKLYDSYRSNNDTYQDSNINSPQMNSMRSEYAFQLSPRFNQEQQQSQSHYQHQQMKPQHPQQKQVNTINYYANKSLASRKELPITQRAQSPIYQQNRVHHIYKKNASTEKMVDILLDENETLQSQKNKAIEKINSMKETMDELNQSQEEIKYECDLQTNKLDVATAHVNELKDQLDFSRKKYEDATEHIRILEEQNAAMKKRVNDLMTAVKQLESNCKQLTQENKSLCNEIRNKDSFISRIQREKDDMFNDFTRQMHELQATKENEIKSYINEINRLENINEILNAKVDELNDSLDKEKLINIQKDKLIPTQKEKDAINYLFNFYTNIKDLIMKQTSNKEKAFKSPEDLRKVLNHLEEQIRKSHSNMIEKMGKCFPCDIACCVSSNERRKFFLNKIPTYDV